MNVLSLFDGISCAKIALDNLSIDVDNYFASEVDVHCINVSKKKFQKIIHLGDVREINYSKLPKIDLLIGGSPCQDLSIAKAGRGLKGSKSNLFYEYVNALNQLKPKYFLLENVKNKWGAKMSELVGTEFVEINSNIFSAQSRPRFYWTNIDYGRIPNRINDDNISNILENKVDKKYYFDKPELGKFISKTSLGSKKTKDGLLKFFDIPREILNDNERQRRVFSPGGKSPTLLARSDTTKILHNNKVRKLTPLECERLQGIPDGFTNILSDTQRYKAIGNGFTVPVIEFFLKNINKEPLNNSIKQTVLFENEIY